MIDAKLFLDYCAGLNYRYITGTPCSYMSEFFKHLINNKQIQYIAAPNEGDAVAFATGAAIANNKSIVVFQNSGLGNAVNPLTSLSQTFNVPFLGIVSLRGDPNGEKDEPQHQLMGAITTTLLDDMQIPWQYFATDNIELQEQLEYIDDYLSQNPKPFFLVMRKNTISKSGLKHGDKHTNSLTRYQALKIIDQKVSDNDIIIGSTGKIGRELYTIGDANNKLYMVGSMGCASSLGLGLSTNKINAKVFVLDGDGSLLMRMSNLAFVGCEQPSNLIHIVIDNGAHDSTGGQATQSEKIDFCDIAAACNYHNIYDVYTETDLAIALDEIYISNKLGFVRIRVKPGSIENLARPSIAPNENAIRIKKLLSGETDETKSI